MAKGKSRGLTACLKGKGTHHLLKKHERYSSVSRGARKKVAIFQKMLPSRCGEKRF